MSHPLGARHVEVKQLATQIARLRPTNYRSVCHVPSVMCSRNRAGTNLRTFVTQDAKSSRARYDFNPAEICDKTPYEEKLRQRKIAQLRCAADPVTSSVKTRMAASEPVTADLTQAYTNFANRLTGADVLRIGNTAPIQRACGGNGHGVAQRLLNMPLWHKNVREQGRVHAVCDEKQMLGKNYTGFAYNMEESFCQRAGKCQTLHSQAPAFKSSGLLLRRGGAVSRM